MKKHLFQKSLLVLTGVLITSLTTLAWGATIFNCGIDVNDTWYKGTGTINDGNWLGDKTAFNGANLGTITGLDLGGQYDTWDNNNTDYCSWNSNNGIWITVKKGATQKANFKLSCWHAEKDGNNNRWKTFGTTGDCADSDKSWGAYTLDISSYAPGSDYTIKASWTSPSSISTEATASFTIPGFTTTETSQTFDNTTVDSNSSKTISFTNHYGTALTTSDCELSGDDASEFEVTSISETGVTVKFKPSTAGSKSATLTITDAHSKTCTITLSGKTQYAVSYNKGSYGTGSNTTANKVYGTNLTLLGETFTRTGYTQTGWATSDGGTKAYNLSGSYTSEAAVTLYPFWTVNNYDITYDPAEAENCTYTTTPSNANYGSTVNLTITPDDGYYIYSVTAVDEGDNSVTVTGSSPNYSFTMPASDVTVTIETRLSTVSVTYGNGGTNGTVSAKVGDDDVDSGDDVAGGSQVDFTATPSTGYEIEGWYETYSAGTFSNKITAAGTSDTYSVDEATSDITVYVKFILSTYSITYENMSGATNNEDNPATYQYTTEDITFGDPTKTGYTFGGWFSDNGVWSDQVTGIDQYSTGDVTIYAKWTAHIYTVQYDANGGTGSMSDSELTYDAGSLRTNTFTRVGYTFSGWNTAANGSGSSYTDGQSSPNVSSTNEATVTLYAQWSARPYKIVYFAKPADWDHVYAYVWKESGTTNATWPGKQLDASVAGTGTEIINCATYYYYKYYTDAAGNDTEGEQGSSTWDKVVFNNGDNPGVANNTKTSDLTLTNGNAYGVHTGMQSTSASGYATSAKWTLRGTFNSWSGATYPFSCADDEHSASVLVEGLTASTNYSFKIFGPDGVAYKYTGGKDESYNDDYSVTSLLDGRDLILNEYASNNNTFTTATTSYLFTLDVTDPKHPVLTIVPGDDADYSVTLAVSGHGKITTPGTGSETIHQYAPTTITAVADPGYRFTGWTVDDDHSSYVTFGNASSLSTNVTGVAGANGATITANFSNDGYVYFDASAVSGFSGGGKVYVTYLNSNDLSWDDGEGKTGALIVKNYISSDLHNQEMTRIPNSNIFYFYTSTTPQGKILFTSKSHDGTDYKLWEMAAVVREDFNVGQDNMFVAENWVLKDKNKTGYYDGYWMKYNESDPGVKLCIYSMGAGTPRISGSPFSFTRTEEGSRIYTTKVTGLTANTQYGIEILGNNGTYYKNNGEMTSTNATGGWDYVDRQATRGTIRTTAAGDYTVQLSCASQLILTVDFPLAVNDYQVVYSGLDSVGGNSGTNASAVIRHIGAAGSKNDTVSFFVVKDDSWTLQLQKCTSVSPSITWANVGDAKTAANFSNPATGVYNFVVKQDSASGTPVTPSFATMTPIAYTGNYYIRTDAADGGWEAYKKSLDNRMVFSNYSKQHSGYDYYHCKYKDSGKNVKFCIANDYSGQLSVVKTTDSYVMNEYGNLPGDANVRFMWNSETNVVGRAYVNGSSTTDFLVLEAKNDSIKNTDDSSIDKVGDLNQVKFTDMGNWVYQKEVKALEGTHYRLTSNYRYGSPATDHIQYFKGASGDWTPANTELLIGGTTSSWQTLRLIYDFKTNHLTAAWLPPTTDITTAKHIEADMLLIRTCQNAAQQLTFTGSGSVAAVKTMIGAIELRYDSIVGKVSSFTNTTRAYRELMYYISFPFDVAVSDIYGFGQLNKEWYLQYYDGAERARKGWFKGDGTTTFWKFMTLSDTLKANVGYSLLLDNDYFNTTGTGTVWENKTSGDRIYLYFPSAKELDGKKVIKSGSAALPIPEHECTINRTFVSEISGRTVSHKFTDSHWNMMGVPLFQNETGVETSKFIAAISTTDPQELEAFPADKGYFYEWDSINNALNVRTTTGYTFKSMHGYMVQFTGTVGFSGSSIQSSSVAARRATLDRNNYTLELQLLQNNNRVSRTYIELREEACDTFALNEDVYMMYSSLPANLFTFAGNYDVSANVLSVANHTIPVGLTVRDAGTYTFSMPSNFSGGVTLVDNVLNTRTNLALSDYEVTLPKGVCEGRFALEIDINETPTSIDVIEDGGSLKDGKAHKFIQNGVLYILKNGVIYDAQGARVR